MPRSDSPAEPAASSPRSAPPHELVASLAELAYTMTVNRTHSRLRSQAAVSVDRASLALLRVLAAAPSPMRLVELADALMVRAPHVTRQIRRLEARGMVEITVEPDDLRARRVQVSEDGREAVHRAETTARQWLAEALCGFSPDELRTTAAVIARIVEAYREE